MRAHASLRPQYVRIIAAILTAILVGCACSDRSATPARVLNWTSCEAGEQCATLTVPMDYTRPRGAQLKLALARISAAKPTERIGVLLVNPGGPGLSGIDFARVAAKTFPIEIRDKFDIVGWDPRGVGQSSPVRCNDSQASTRPPEGISTSTETAHADGKTDLAKLGALCLAGTGPELGYVDTLSSARDMEQIRLALHEDSISFLGYSYGTFLGAEYADQYPKRVRAFVLDSGVDPSLTFTDQVEGSALALENAFDAFLADCSAHSNCPFNADSTRARFDALKAHMDSSPVDAVASDGSRVHIDGSVMIDATYNAITSGRWIALSQALADLESRRDGSGLAALLSIGSTANDADEFVAKTAIDCLDRAAPTTSELQQLSARLRLEAPAFVTDHKGVVPSECGGWPVPAKRRAQQVHALGTPPVLVIGATHDPITPYSWSVDLAAELSSGVLLTWTGHEHTVAFYSPSRNFCVDAIVTQYLVERAVPPSGSTCN